MRKSAAPRQMTNEDILRLDVHMPHELIMNVLDCLGKAGENNIFKASL